jgi:hypothetical protein
VEKMFVGHVRFGVDGAAEFAKGWNETHIPKTEISASSRPELLASRGWFDAYSTSSRVEPIAMESCRCGQKKSDLMPRRFGRTPPARPVEADGSTPDAEPAALKG